MSLLKPYAAPVFSGTIVFLHQVLLRQLKHHAEGYEVHNSIPHAWNFTDVLKYETDITKSLKLRMVNNQNLISDLLGTPDWPSDCRGHD